MSDRNILAELQRTVYHQCSDMTIHVSLKDKRTDEFYVFSYHDNGTLSSERAVEKALTELDNMWRGS